MQTNYRQSMITNLSSLHEDIINTKNIKIAGIENINSQLSNHFIIYEILNLNNGKYYIGQHETKDPCDNYMGSGHYLQAAKTKEGLSAFAKIILFDFDNYDDMNLRELEMVQLSNCYPYDPMSYNLMEGSHNGRLSQASIDKANATKAKNGGYAGERNSMYGEKMLDHMTQEAYNEMRRKQIENNKFSEMIHDLINDPIRYNAWRKKISESHKKLKLSSEHKQHIGQAFKHLHYYNNGINEVRCKTCPLGCKPGRIKKYWWNNGQIEVLQIKCPDGFTSGRIPFKKK